MAEKTAEESVQDDAVAALRYLLDEDGPICINGVIIRFMQMGEVADNGDGTGFRARQSGVFTRPAAAVGWTFQARYDQFNEFARPILEKAGEVQCAVLRLRSAICGGRSLLKEMDKETEATIERLKAIVSDSESEG